jgi:hypothetical protein
LKEIEEINPQVLEQEALFLEPYDDPCSHEMNIDYATEDIEDSDENVLILGGKFYFRA